MKPIKNLSFIFAAALCLLPVFGYAAGTYTPGTVVVTSTSLTGAYNVRYNPAVSQGKVDAYAVNNLIYFSGIDSNSGAGFNCYVNSVNSIYPAAEKAVYGSGNGVVITVFKPSGSAACSSITYRNASNHLD
jgi:hypothetical protein